MINTRRTNTNINRENVQRLVNKAASVVERRATIQLSGRHPELLLRIHPHSIDPKETLIVNEDGPRAIGRDLQNLLSIRVADVNVAMRVNCSAA